LETGLTYYVNRSKTSLIKQYFQTLLTIVNSGSVVIYGGRRAP